MSTQLISLTQMQNTVRKMTARYSPEQLTDTQLNNYINIAYTLHFPEQFKNLKLTKPYVFNTIPNVDTYDFIYENNPTNPLTGTQVTASPGNIQITPPVYCQGYILRYYQDKTTFYNRWPKLTVNQIIGTGSGSSATTYSGNIPVGTPFLRAQLDIFGNVTEAAVIISAFNAQGGTADIVEMVLTDQPVDNSDIGNLIDQFGTVVGTVNYLTGAYTFKPLLANGTSPATLTADMTIYASVVPYQSSRPTDVIFYNQQITFRPVPQQVYQVEFQISQQPTQLLAAGAAPELDEWYLLICALASKLIYTDFPDPEGMAYLQPILDEQVQWAQRRSLRQLGSQRASTIFSQPGRPLASWFWGTEYSGTSG